MNTSYAVHVHGQITSRRAHNFSIVRQKRLYIVCMLIWNVEWLQWYQSLFKSPYLKDQINVKKVVGINPFSLHMYHY